MLKLEMKKGIGRKGNPSPLPYIGGDFKAEKGNGAFKGRKFVH